MKNWIEDLTEDIINGRLHDEDDVDEFAKAHSISVNQVYHQLAVIETRGTVCEGCKHIQMRSTYSPMYPCNSCSRICRDYFELEKEKK